MHPEKCILIAHNVDIEDIHIEVKRKAIRQLHLRVYPDGRVRVSAPWLYPNWMIQSYVEAHLDWIRKSRARLMAQGERPPLPAVSASEQEAFLRWLPERLEYWRVIMGEAPVTWKVRNMKTQWGNCRAQRRLLTFNLQLARIPENLRDYILVHELAHLKVPNHSPSFYAHVARFMPDWAERRKALKSRIYN